MIRSITQKKPEKEIERLLKGLNRIFIIGCGTCVTLTRTGGEPEVRAMQEELSAKGKMVTGQTVVPVACDNLTREFLSDFRRADRPGRCPADHDLCLWRSNYCPAVKKDGDSGPGYPVYRQRNRRGLI